jgi:hypothetical protein
VLELVAYINTSGRPSRRERSERHNSDVHGAGVYWLIGVIKFVGGTIRLWGCGGILEIFVQFRTICTESVRVGFWIFSYIYLIDVNLDYYQNNSRLSMDVGKLSNHIKSVSLSLDLSLFDSIYCSLLLCAVTTECFRITCYTMTWFL